MRGWKVLATGVLALLASVSCSPALAGEPYTLAHDYAFHTLARNADNRPLCEERWTFEPDGTAAIVSGREVVHYRYRLVGNWLTFDRRETNGEPDCTGRPTAKEPEPQKSRLYIIPFLTGGFLVCSEKPGDEVTAANCPARADPVH